MKIFKNGKKIFMTFAGVLSLAVLVFYHAGIILAAVPTITTGIAESIGKTSATLNSTINDNGGKLISSTGFEYGLTNSYGSQVTGIQSYEFVSYFGQTPGTAEGEFGSTILSSDSLFLSVNKSTGVLYVTDIENNRIQVFDSDGNFIKTFGWGVSTGASQFEICTSGCQTGISGSGDGQFNGVRGIAVDSNTGYVYAYDNNNRIQKFTESGNYVSQFGSSGSGDGQFGSIYDLAIDSLGNVYLFDSLQNNRIVVFDSDGNFIKTFGWGVSTGASQFEICTSGCQTGISGSGDGQFNGGGSYEGHIAIDSYDNIYVLDVDSAGYVLQKFSNSLVFVDKKAFGWLLQYTAVELSPDDRVLLLSYEPQNILVLDTELSTITSFYHGDGVINPVYGKSIGINGEGDVFVPYNLDNLAFDPFLEEPINRGIRKFSLDTTISKDVSGLTCGTTYHYRAFATNADGTSYGNDATFTTLDCELPLIYTKPATDISVNAVYLNAMQIDNVSVSTTARGFEWGTTTSYGNTVNYSPVRNSFNAVINEFINWTVNDIASAYVRYDNKAYTANKSYHSIEMYDALDGNYPTMILGWGVETGASQFEICTSGCQTGISGSGDGQFNAPEGIVYNSNSDKIYVSDTGNNRIQVFDSSGNYLSQFGSFGTGDGQFSSPKGLSTHGDYVYVVDSGNNRIQRFTTSGVFVSKLSGLNSPSFLSPNSTGSGYLYVANTGSSNILRMDQSLSTSTIINFSYSSGIDPLNTPVGIASDSRDNLFITDINDRVLFAAPVASGELDNYIFLASFGENGSGTNQFSGPKSVAEDNTGILPNLVIADSGNNRVVSTNPFMQSRQNSGNGLDCNTTYHYRAFATNADGTAYGDDMTFTTLPCPSSNGVGGGGDDDEIEGCTDIYASNFNTDATVDDGSCQYDDISGCTNPSANNYDMTATVDDGSCSFVGGGGNDDIPGCTDPSANNYNTTATVDDGSCSFGSDEEDFCLDPSASNFNEEGDCDYPSIPIAGCTDPTAIGYYNPVATIDNGTCPNIDEPPIDPVTEINQVIGRIFDDTSSQAETYKDIAIIGLVFPAMWSLIVDRTAFFSLALRLWNLIPTLLGLRRKRRPWGTVYDSVTKQPLDPAYVTLLGENKQEIQKSITDIDGRYGFWATIGKYFIDVKKSDYIFPSTKLTGRGKDELYDNLYFGGEINVENEDEIINKNIPMDAINFNWNEFEKSRNKKLMKFFSRGELFLARIARILFIVGFTASFFLVFLEPKVFNYVVLGIYFLITILSFVGIKPRKPGFIFEKSTGIPMSYSILYVFSALLNQEVAHTIVGKTGKYYVLVQKGEYYLKIKKKIGENEYADIYTSDIFKSKKGYINKIIKI